MPDDRDRPLIEIENDPEWEKAAEEADEEEDE